MLKTVRTTKCKLFNHYEFESLVEPGVPQNDVFQLLSFLEETVASGVEYKDNETIAFGVMILRIKKKNDVLLIQEPDFCEFPINWTVNISHSLWTLRVQKDTADSVGLVNAIDFPSIRYGIWVGVDLRVGSRHFFMRRTGSSEASNSGWFIGAINSELNYNDAAQSKCTSIYQALLDWPAITYFLALPAGIDVYVSSESVDILLNDEELQIEKGSFLDVIEPQLVGLDASES